MRFDRVIFDFDGTVADTGRGIMKCVGYALEKLGKAVPEESTLRKFVGPPLVTSFMEYAGLNAEDADRAVALYRERYSEKGLYEAEIYPGIRPLLRALKACGIHAAVASGKPTLYLNRIIDHFGLTEYFEGVAGPDMRNHSADKQAQILQVLPKDADLGRACMVGDRRFDVESGRALGMHTVGASFGYGSREELERAGADFVADNTEALAEYLLDGAPMPRGRMISFEGTDGCGKSTQMKLLGDWLRSRGEWVVTTREPGGCPIAEKIRALILSLDSKGMSAECEALLYAAARIEHVREVMTPALRMGKIVLCDRYLDSSIAYQAYGRELGEDFIRQINRTASEEVMPDCTLQFDIDRTAAKARMAQGAPLDRLELEKEDFFTRVGRGYDAIAQAEPGRICRIDSGRSIDEVFRDVLAAIHSDGLTTTRG